jgi:DNA polymerase III delta prime subunit
MDELPWLEKHRPKILADVIGHDRLINALRAMINKGILLNLLFYGAPGTGKTSTILAIAREYYGSEAMIDEHVLELNASDDRGINVIRERIIPFTNFCTVKRKLVILDEADNMTLDAQNALKRVMETSASQCAFCLICNEVSKLNDALIDRCHGHLFGAIPPSDKHVRARYICDTESLPITDEALTYICENEHDFRQIITKLQYMKYARTLTTPINIEELAFELRLPTPVILDELISLYSQMIVDPIKTFPQLYGKWKFHYYANRCSLTRTIEALAKRLSEQPQRLTPKQQIELLSRLLITHSRLKEGDNPDIQLFTLSLLTNF